MNTNNSFRREPDLPIAAGSEILTLFTKEHRVTCEAECRDGKSKVILCRTSEAYFPPLGENIKRLRLSENMTQRQLAYYLKVSMQAVSKWERGVSHS